MSKTAGSASSTTSFVSNSFYVKSRLVDVFIATTYLSNILSENEAGG